MEWGSARMSFAAEAKMEICKNGSSRPCCEVAELYGMLLFANIFSTTEIRIRTENAAVYKRAQTLLRRAFGVTAREEIGKAALARYALDITAKEEVARILKAYGYDLNAVTLPFNRAVTDEECCRSAFLRGAFLVGGSVTNPEKKYHLELVTPSASLSRQVMSFLLDYGMAPKLSRRKYHYLIYFKESTAIEDFLTAVGAPLAAMELMQIKVEKELRNDLNRKVNCETANIMKSVDAAAKQIEAISVIMEHAGLQTLKEELRQTAQMRVDYPECSLTELARKFDPPLSRAGLNHRLKKIMEIAAAYQTDKEQQ